MSLRCSLLGHDYGEVEIERERDEQGSEVVVTVREFESCERCGDRKVVSENTEVTTLDAREDATVDGATTGDRGGEADAGGPADAGDAGDAGDASTDPDAAAAGGSQSVDEEFEPRSAEDDDGVILDDAPSEGDGRPPGEWPDVDTTHPAEVEAGDHEPWPETDHDDEGFDAEPADDASADVEFEGGLTPTSAPDVEADEADDVEFVDADGNVHEPDESGPTGDLSAGITASAEAPSVAGPAEDPTVDAEFVCPACGYRDVVAGSSLRAGDICPECRKGYIARE